MSVFSYRRKILLILVVLAALPGTGIVLFGHAIGGHLRAMSVLLKFADPQASGVSVQFASRPFTEEDGSVETPSGPLRYRLYIPKELPHPPGLVIAPGVHHLGIQHPGLIALSRAMASAGIEVLTPELSDLADYRITPRSADMIGSAAVALSERLHQEKVGVLGLSFSGGLALLAATKPEYAGRIGFVFSIGAHDDMTRVARFFATNTVETPDAGVTPFTAHEYGALILAYSHLGDFFSAPDIPQAREALRLWLWEQPEATQKAQELSRNGRAEWDLLLHHRDRLQQKFLDEVERYSDEMLAVSPHGKLQDLAVPVFLLHGAGDNVIPAAECMWLAKDVPEKDVKAVLVSAALIHVKMGETVTLKEKWQLVDFLAQVLDSADRLAVGHRE